MPADTQYVSSMGRRLDELTCAWIGAAHYSMEHRRHTDIDSRLALLKNYARCRVKVRELVLRRKAWAGDANMLGSLEPMIQFWRKAARNWKAEIMSQ